MVGSPRTEAGQTRPVPGLGPMASMVSYNGITPHEILYAALSRGLPAFEPRGSAKFAVRRFPDREFDRRCALEKGRLAVEARIKANPRDAGAYYDLSRVALAFEDLEQAEHAGEKAVEMNGSNADYHAQLATVYATAAEHASVLKQVVLVHKMRREIESSLAIDPNNIDALLVDAAFNWQAPAVVGGSRQKSLAIVNRLKAISPLWGNLMEARLFQNEDKGRTEQALQAAANVRPAFYRAQILLADFYAAGSDSAKWPEAERIAKQSLHQFPDRIGAYNTSGQTLR